MNQKSEKYRALKVLIEDQTKAELFGNNGLFGNFHGDHSVLIQFVNYLDGIKKEYRHIPTTVSSKTFVDYLSREAKEKENSAEIIKKIDSLRTRGFIVDEPAAKNTFLKFALVLDNLGIIENQKLISISYDAALELAINLKPVSPEPQLLVGAEGHSVTGITESSVKVGTNHVNNTETSSERAEPSREVHADNQKITTDSEEKAPETEESADISADTESRNEEKNRFSRTVKINIRGGIPRENDSANYGIESGLTKDQQKTPDSSVNNLVRPARHSFGKPSSKELFREKEDLMESPKDQESELKLPDFPSFQDGLPEFPQKSGTARVRNSGGGLRKLINKPERLREPAQPADSSASQNPGYQQNAVNHGGENIEQAMTPERTTESGKNTVRRSSGSHLGKKLAKLAGIGVAGGTFLPLFAGGSAEAAAANLARDLLMFVSRLFS